MPRTTLVVLMLLGVCLAGLAAAAEPQPTESQPNKPHNLLDMRKQISDRIKDRFKLAPSSVSNRLAAAAAPSRLDRSVLRRPRPAGVSTRELLGVDAADSRRIWNNNDLFAANRGWQNGGNKRQWQANVAEGDTAAHRTLLGAAADQITDDDRWSSGPHHIWRSDPITDPIIDPDLIEASDYVITDQYDLDGLDHLNHDLEDHDAAAPAADSELDSSELGSKINRKLLHGRGGGRGRGGGGGRSNYGGGGGGRSGPDSWQFWGGPSTGRLWQQQQQQRQWQDVNRNWVGTK